jgi:hypothetical protein
MKTRHSFVVKRSEWLRGSRESFLLREDGKKCCVGFLCLSLGASAVEICDRTQVEEDTPIAKRFIRNFRFSASNTNWAGDVYIANDRADLDDSARETKLTELFKQRGIAVTFED